MGSSDEDRARRELEFLPVLPTMQLGRVDGFDDHEAGGEGDEEAKVPGRFFAAQGDALEAFELADGLLDAGAAGVELAREEGSSMLAVTFDGIAGQMPRREGAGEWPRCRSPCGARRAG